MKRNVSVLLIFLFISAVSAFWYFGHYRPAKIMPPVKIYKTTIPDPSQSKVTKGVSATPTPTEKTRNEIPSTSTPSDLTGEEFVDNSLSVSDPVGSPDTTAESTTAPEQSEASPHEAPPQEHNVSEEFKEISEEVDAALASGEKHMEEGALAMAKMLMSKPAEEQRIMWKNMKDSFFTAKSPVTQEPLLTPEQAEAAWQNIVNIIKRTGYIPPEGVQ